MVPAKTSPVRASAGRASLAVRLGFPKHRKLLPARIVLGQAGLTPTAIPIVPCRTSPGCKRLGSLALDQTASMPPGVSNVPRHYLRRSDHQKERECVAQVVQGCRPMDRGKCVPDAIPRGRPPEIRPFLLGNDPANLGPVLLARRTSPIQGRAVLIPSGIPIAHVRISPARERPDSVVRRRLLRIAPRPVCVQSVPGPHEACRWQVPSPSPSRTRRRTFRLQIAPIGRDRGDPGTRTLPRVHWLRRCPCRPEQAKKFPRHKISREKNKLGPGDLGVPGDPENATVIERS